MFVSLRDEQLKTKKEFINNYINSHNAASAAIFDANANVSTKNIATLEAELNKDINIQVNRKLLGDKIEGLYGQESRDTYLRYLKDHIIYVHDETSLKPYCASISLYPLLLSGLEKLGGESKAPKHLASFCGSFVNLVFASAAQFAGAIATVEFLMYFDYFARKDFGDDYLETHTKIVENWLQHVVYCLNQPAAARGYQSVFWNISIYDKYYFDSMFGDFVFPDTMEKPVFESLNRLQKHFMTWFNKEREAALLTYPIVTVALLTDPEKGPKDDKLVDFLSKEMEEGNSFFVYMSESADSLASCCRLRNELTDNSFSYSLGAGGVSTGSLNVITINLNRVTQSDLSLEKVIRNVQKFQIAFRHLFQEFRDAGMLPVYNAGFINADNQFLTLGVNGLVEAAEYLGIEPLPTKEYKNYVKEITGLFYKLNKEAAEKTGFKFNTEMVPAENLGVKNAKWDKRDGLRADRECYNSYFYRVEDQLDVSDSFEIYSKDFTENLDGGSALHLNLREHLTKKQYIQLFKLAAKKGCSYWCVNVLSSFCNSCGKIDKRTISRCSNCQSEDLDYATRVIGYLKKIKSFSKARQKEAHVRDYKVLDKEISL